MLKSFRSLLKTTKAHLEVFGVIGSLWVGVTAALRGPAIFKVMRKECRFPIWLRVPSTDVVACSQVLIGGCYDFESECVPKVIVDAGANIGIASVLFASRFPNARIFAIEPEPANFQMLKRNTEQYPNIVAINAALWGSDEELDCFDTGGGDWAFIMRSASEQEQTSKDLRSRIPGRTLSTLMREYKLDHIDVLKIDIEGSEKEVFQDASLWIEMVDSIIVELHERLRTGCNRSFYAATGDFGVEWCQGDCTVASRPGCLKRPTAPLRN